MRSELVLLARTACGFVNRSRLRTRSSFFTSSRSATASMTTSARFSPVHSVVGHHAVEGVPSGQRVEVFVRDFLIQKLPGSLPWSAVETRAAGLTSMKPTRMPAPLISACTMPAPIVPPPMTAACSPPAVSRAALGRSACWRLAKEEQPHQVAARVGSLNSTTARRSASSPAAKPLVYPAAPPPSAVRCADSCRMSWPVVCRRAAEDAIARRPSRATARSIHDGR